MTFSIYCRHCRKFDWDCVLCSMANTACRRTDTMVRKPNWVATPETLGAPDGGPPAQHPATLTQEERDEIDAEYVVNQMNDGCG